jgi:UDP-N-acetylglucosamine diphosphorylase/glucosamine-1-phosphate N-acetyltransferase
MEPVVLIMAGGLGKRMNSTLPKVLHKVLNYPMLVHVIKTSLQLEPKKVIIIVGKYKDVIDSTIKKYLLSEEYDKIEYAYQEEALGTGHAVMCSLYNLSQYIEHKALILSGDVPLISKETLSSLNSEYEDRMLITDLDIPKACGRIIFNEDKTKVDGIVEEKECNDEQKLINYVNCGIYQISVQNLFKFVPLIDNNNKTGEFYLTDIVKLMKNNGEQIGFHDLSKEKQYEIKNVNTKEDLDKLNEDIKDIVKK